MRYKLNNNDEIEWVREDGTLAEYKILLGSLLQIGKPRVKQYKKPMQVCQKHKRQLDDHGNCRDCDSS